MSRSRRVVTTLGAAGVVGLVFAGGVWAGRVVFAPPAPLPSSQPFTVVIAKEGAVGATIRLNASAEWAIVERPRMAASGVATAISIKPGQEINAGDRLLEVDAHPVVAGQGTVPAFRDLGPGDSGPDVRQLERLLADDGRDVVVDGRLTQSEGQAVRAWQRARGMAATGTVRAGAIVWFTSLPGKATLSSDVRIGESIAPSTGAVARLEQAASFSLSAGQEDSAQLSPGMGVEIQAGNEKWSAKIGSVKSGADPETGQAQVTAALVASGQGRSIVEGITVGTAVRVPGDLTDAGG